MTMQRNDPGLMHSMGLEGLTHIWGHAGSGKTLLAVAFAADESVNSAIEWINTDGKMSFVSHLKRNVTAHGGRMSNVTTFLTLNYAQSRDCIMNVASRVAPLTSLVVVDPVTRVIDMARLNPTLWGQQLIEEVLPTLAGVASNGVKVVVISESRVIDGAITCPVHHESIRQWVDHDIAVRRDATGPYSTIIGTNRAGLEIPLGKLRLLNTGIVEVSAFGSARW